MDTIRDKELREEFVSLTYGRCMTVFRGVFLHKIEKDLLVYM